MKKIIFSLIFFLTFPICVSAADYDITDFLVKAQIVDNGDLKVQELIVLSGEFNGYERDILYANSELVENTFSNNEIYNATDIADVSIKAKYVGAVSFDTFNESDFESFSLVSYASNGSKAMCVPSNLTNGYRFRMYYPSNGDKVAFYLTYTVKDAVVLHNDVAELYWTFVPNGFEDELNHIGIELYLPQSDTSDYFRIWAHGNLSGEVYKIDDRGVKATINKVLPGESVDVRTTFDKNLITNTSNIKRSYVNGLDKIIEVEEKRAEVANNLREKLLSQYNFIKYATLVYYGSVLILGVIIYFKYGKSPKSGYYSKYNREFIDDYNVEIIDYLMNKKLTPNAMSASIMNLIYKKNITATELTEESKKNEKHYKFVLENTDNLNESEAILIEFLFDKVGKNDNNENKKTFTTKDLKTYANGVKTCNNFIVSYTKWKNNVTSLAKSENFYISSNIPKAIGLVFFIIGFAIFVAGLNYGVDYTLFYFILIVAIIFLIYSLLIDKKTEKGALHYDKWKAFKNFLNDFGSFELKELPEVILWERYLVYATIFGLASKVQKSMNVHIKELELTSDYDYYPSFFYINLGDTINTSVNNAINSAYSRQAANYSNSHSSSSSGGGFGGGFSSGGGFGGGGGGGRGF